MHGRIQILEIFTEQKFLVFFTYMSAERDYFLVNIYKCFFLHYSDITLIFSVRF